LGSADRGAEAVVDDPAGARDHRASIRPATLDDIGAIRALLAAHGNDDPPGALRGPDVVGPYVRHLLAHHRVLVTSDAAEAIVAFGAVVDTGLSNHLADLFVRPDLLGCGLGRPLLSELFGDRWPRTTLASDDPRALPLYVRAGMAARWPVLYMQGGRAQAERAAADPRARRIEVVAADPAELAELERTWTGADRSVDHELESSIPGADPFLVRDAEGPLAAGYGRDRQTAPDARAVDRLVLRPGAEPVGTVLAAVARATAGGATIDVAVPGPHPALPVLLELGFRIGDRDTYMAGPTDPIDPWRLLPNGGLL
jgi:GNAT superfamily N-acetyltransferase